MPSHHKEVLSVAAVLPRILSKLDLAAYSYHPLYKEFHDTPIFLGMTVDFTCHSTINFGGMTLYNLSYYYYLGLFIND